MTRIDLGVWVVTVEPKVGAGRSATLLLAAGLWSAAVTVGAFAACVALVGWA